MSSSHSFRLFGRRAGTPKAGKAAPAPAGEGACGHPGCGSTKVLPCAYQDRWQSKCGTHWCGKHVTFVGEVPCCPQHAPLLSAVVSVSSPVRPQSGHPTVPIPIQPEPGKGARTCGVEGCSNFDLWPCGFKDQDGHECGTWWCGDHVEFVGQNRFCHRHASLVGSIQGTCGSPGCLAREVWLCSYRDRHGQECGTTWCREHVGFVGAVPFCDEHAGLIGTLSVHHGSVREIKTLPTLDDRCASLAEFVSEEVGDQITSVLKQRYADRPDVQIIADERVRDMWYQTQLVWWRTWGALTNAGYLTRIAIWIPMVAPPVTPTVHVLVDSNIVFKQVPDWIIRDQRGEAPHPSDLPNFSARILEAVHQAIDMPAPFLVGGRPPGEPLTPAGGFRTPPPPPPPELLTPLPNLPVPAAEGTPAPLPPPPAAPPPVPIAPPVAVPEPAGEPAPPAAAAASTAPALDARLAGAPSETLTTSNGWAARAAAVQAQNAARAVAPAGEEQPLAAEEQPLAAETPETPEPAEHAESPGPEPAEIPPDAHAAAEAVQPVDELAAPVAELDPAAPGPAESHAPDATAGVPVARRVMVVAEDGTAAGSLTQIVRELDWMQVVSVCVDPIQALDEAAHLRPELIFVHLELSSTAGLWLAEQATSEMPGVHVVLLTEDGSSVLLRRAHLAGAEDVLVWPYTSRDLAASAVRLLPPEPPPLPDPPIAHAGREPAEPALPDPPPAAAAGQAADDWTDRGRPELTEPGRPALDGASGTPSPDGDGGPVSVKPAMPPPPPGYGAPRLVTPAPPPAPALSETPQAAEQPSWLVAGATPAPAVLPTGRLAPLTGPAAVSVPLPPAASAAVPGEADTRGEVTVVFSGKGGVGKSLIATNMAAAIVQCCDCEVGLVDLDLQFGDLGMLLNVKPATSISNVVEGYPDLDPQFLSDLMPAGAEGIRLMAAPVSPELADLVNPDHVKAMLEGLRAIFRHLVVDLGGHLDDRSLEAVQAADHILLITDLDLSTIKNARLALTLFDRLGIPRSRVFVVLNRSDARTPVTPDEVEKMLMHPVAAQIPTENAFVQESVRDATPLVKLHPEADLSRALMGLVEQIGYKAG